MAELVLAQIMGTDGVWTCAHVWGFPAPSVAMVAQRSGWAEGWMTCAGCGSMGKFEVRSGRD